STPRHCRDNFPGACRFLAFRCRTADENSRSARCIAWAGDVVRADDFDAGQMRNRGVSELDARLEIRCGRIESLDQIINFGRCFLDNGDDDCLRAGLDGKPKLEPRLRSALRSAADVVIRYGSEVE